jgi:hypothetical protein
MFNFLCLNAVADMIMQKFFTAVLPRRRMATVAEALPGYA